MTWSVVAAVAAVIAVIASIFQWHVAQNYKRLTEQHSDLEKRVSLLESEVCTCRNRAQALRDELHKEYVDMTAYREMESVHNRNFENLFTKLSALSQAINQIIGELRASRRYSGNTEAIRADDIV